MKRKCTLKGKHEKAIKKVRVNAENELDVVSFRNLIPEVLCREEQRSRIVEWISERLSGKCASALHASGPPGTGKTFLMKAIVDTVKGCMYVNCMQISAHNGLQSEISKLAKIDPQHVLQHLSRSTTLLILDEIDQLLPNRKLQRKHMSDDEVFLMKLLRIALQSDYKLALIGVSNALSDLEDRFHKCSGMPKSDTHLRTIIFPPYSREQVNVLIEKDTKSFNKSNVLIQFEETALMWCSARVSNSSGDLRGAIEIARLGYNAAIQAGRTTVTVKDLSDLANNDGQNRPSDFVLSYIHRLVLKELLMMVEMSTVNNRVYPGTISQCYESFRRHDQTVLNRMEYEHIIGCLSDLGIISLVEPKRSSRGFGNAKSNFGKKRNFSMTMDSGNNNVKLNRHPDDLKLLVYTAGTTAQDI